jgi:hypothetical protein
MLGTSWPGHAGGFIAHASFEPSSHECGSPSGAQLRSSAQVQQPPCTAAIVVGGHAGSASAQRRSPPSSQVATGVKPPGSSKDAGETCGSGASAGTVTSVSCGRVVVAAGSHAVVAVGAANTGASGSRRSVGAASLGAATAVAPRVSSAGAGRASTRDIIGRSITRVTISFARGIAKATTTSAAATATVRTSARGGA